MSTIGRYVGSVDYAAIERRISSIEATLDKLTNTTTTSPGEKLANSIRSTRAIVIAIAAFALLIAVASAIVAGIALNQVNNYQSPLAVSVAQQLPSAPNVFYVVAAGAPVALTLPNDLTPYVGRVYRIWSLTAQPHTVTIASGSTASTFTGGATVATFGGAVGEGFVYEVVSSTHVVVVSANGVTFS